MDVTWIYVGIAVISAGVLIGKWLRKRKQAAGGKAVVAGSDRPFPP
jgi:hypothetical protein